MKTDHKSVSFPAPVYSAYRASYEASRLHLGANGIYSFPAYCLFLMAEGTKSLEKKERHRRLENMAIKESEGK